MGDIVGKRTFLCFHYRAFDKGTLVHLMGARHILFDITFQLFRKASWLRMLKVLFYAVKVFIYGQVQGVWDKVNEATFFVPFDI